MESDKDVSTVLDAYHQLERGRSLPRIKAAANRLRLFDPMHELLPELEAKIELVNQAASTVAFSRPEHDRHHAA